MATPDLPTPPVDSSLFNNPFKAFWHAITHISCTGRACRKEYWMAFLGNIIVAVILGALLGVIDVIVFDAVEQDSLFLTVVDKLYDLLTLVVFLPLGIRRLHDTGRSGWWCLIGLIPIIGAIVLLVFLCTDSESGENKYGANPKGC